MFLLPDRPSRACRVLLGFISAVALVTAGTPRALAVDRDDSGASTLQSVDVSVAPGGDLYAVQSTSIKVSKDGDNRVTGTSETKQYSPTKSASELPARITTSYRTADSVGNNLADLNGYTGRLELSITVQNLTVRPEQLEFDVGGHSEKRTELVGTPLTVAASTELGVPVSSVVRPGTSSGQKGTNGIISANSQGDAHIQWATVLAPPVMDAAAHFNVVADVHDFSLPEFHLTVQPGLTADATLGGAMTTAFGIDTPDNQLISQTIDVMAQLDELLVKAGELVGDTREALNSAGTQIGTRTIADLRAGSDQITAQTQGLIGSLNALQNNVSSTMGSTNSAIRTQLDATTCAVATALGDTNATAPVLQHDSHGCVASVERTGKSQTVFGTVLEVQSLLNAYADAAEGCSQQVQSVLVTALGPEEPSTDTCQNTGGLTCDLFASKEQFNATLAQLSTDANEAVAALNTGTDTSAAAQAAQLITTITGLQDSVSTFTENRDPNTVKQQVRVLRQSLRGANRTLDNIDAQFNALNRAAQDGRAQSDTMESTRADLETEICALAPESLAGSTAGPTSGVEATEPAGAGSSAGTDSGATPSANATSGGDSEATSTTPTPSSTPSDEPTTHARPLNRAQAKRLLIHLNNTACNSGQHLGGSSDNLKTSIAENTAAWDKLITDTAPLTVDGESVSHTQATRDALEEISAAIDQIDADDKNSSGNLDKFLRDLTGGLAEAQQEATGLNETIGDIATERENLQQKLSTMFAENQTELSREISAQIDSSIRMIGGTSKQSNADVSAIFSSLVIQMTAAGQNATAETKQNLDATVAGVKDIDDVMSKKAQENIDAGLASINEIVANSASDTRASNALLTADIQRVLADIGSNSSSGGGLLGTVANSAGQAGAADEQIAAASSQTAEQANMERNRLANAALATAEAKAVGSRVESLAPFMTVRSGTDGAQVTTIYNYTVGAQE